MRTLDPGAQSRIGRSVAAAAHSARASAEAAKLAALFSDASLEAVKFPDDALLDSDLARPQWELTGSYVCMGRLVPAMATEIANAARSAFAFIASIRLLNPSVEILCARHWSRGLLLPR